VLVDVGVVDQEEDAAWSGFPEKVYPVDLPHGVFAADIAARLDAQGFPADLRPERGDRLAAGRRRLRVKVAQVGRVAAQPFQEGGLAGLAVAEYDEGQAQHADVGEVDHAADRVADPAGNQAAQRAGDDRKDAIAQGFLTHHYLLSGRTATRVWCCLILRTGRGPVAGRQKTAPALVPADAV